MLTLTAADADEGWSFSKLNPFGSSTPAPARAPTGTGARRTGPRKPVAKTSSPLTSTWNSVSQGTSRFMGKTKQVLTPWNQPAPQPTKISLSRTNPNRKPRPQPEAPAWYEFWKSDPEQDRGPKTVNEFLALPRPE